MTHIGLLCPTAMGHLNPMLTLGRELRRRAHQVTVFQVIDAQPTVEAAGLGFYRLGAQTFPQGRIAQITERLGELQGLQAVRHSVEWIRQTTELMLAEMPTAARNAGVEILIIDQIMVEGETIAQRLGLPFISLCGALLVNRDPLVPPFITNWRYDASLWGRLRNRLGYAGLDSLTRPVFEVVQSCRQQWGLPLYGKQSHSMGHPYSPLLQISQQPREFEFPRTTLPDWFHWVGPLHDGYGRAPVAFPYERLSGKPLVYASLGTLQNRQHWLFEAIAQACAELPVQLVLSLGNAQGQDESRYAPWSCSLPGSPIVVPYAPQLELLSRAVLTITHAGLNTTLEALTHGVPLVAIPITNDQPGVASRIAWTGVGEVIPLGQVNVARLRAAVEQVLTYPSYRQRALEMQQAIQRSGGVQRAADLVEGVIQKQPSLGLVGAPRKRDREAFHASVSY